MAVCLAILLATVYWRNAATIVRFASNKGEVIIETDGADLEVTVRSGGATILDHATDRRFELTAGDYEIGVSERPDGLKFFTKRFTLSRGG